MNKVKAFLTRVSGKAKYLASAMAVGCTAAAATVVSSAEGTTTAGLSTYTDSIISLFTNMANDVIPVVIGILGAGLTIFGVFTAFRLGKKAISTVSK